MAHYNTCFIWALGTVFVVTNLFVRSQGQCVGYNRTTYLLSSGYELSGGAQIQQIDNYTLEQCRELCDLEPGCESFLHNADTKICMILGQSAQPLGPGQLVQLADPDMMFYQKLCIPSQLLCDSTHSFERFPQKVLVGVTEEVVQASTLSECLKSCLESMSLFKIQCKSAMYFYDTKECILNSFDQRQRPDLFSADTLGFIVDYFDNNCLGTVCPSPGIVQYIRTPDSELKGGKTTQLNAIDLQTCKYFCTVNQNGQGGSFVCNSFMYNPSNRYCRLSSQSSQPQGRTQFTSSPGIELFEKNCFTSSSTCGDSASFDRYPLSVLVGLSKEVINKSSLSQCLDACLESVRQLGFICLSAMFFYDTAECLLNEESRVTRADLFSYDTKGARVDYFENLCGPNPKVCGKDDNLSFIRISNALLPGLDSSSLFPGFSSAECVQKCALEPNFVCRSVDVTSEGCLLSYQNSDAQALTYNPPSDSIYYQAICLKDSSKCGNYFYSFSMLMDRALVGYSTEKLEQVSPDDCLSACLAAGCLSVNYDRQKSVCEINNESCRTVGVVNLKKMERVDYYENKCIPAPTSCEFSLIAQNMRLKPVFRMQVLNVDRVDECRESCLASSEFFCRSFTFNGQSQSCELSDVDHIDVDKEGIDILGDQIAFSYYARTCQGEVGKLEATVTPVCGTDGVHITVRYPRQTNGAIFVKNYFSTCRTVFRQSLVATLLIPFPGSGTAGRRSGLQQQDSAYDPTQQVTTNCDGQEIARNVFMYVIVVEENSGVDVPGILTSDDRLFNVTCDYSQTSDTDDVSATYPLGPSGRVGQIQMQILRRDEPVSAVLLGETVELKWKIKERTPGIGYFVKECFAERVGGNPPDPGPVKLVSKGCPDPGIHEKLMTSPISEVPDGFKTSLTVFRFDGSRSVRMRCVIEMCVDQCAPTSCTLSNGTFISMGRKKRQLYTYYPDRDPATALGYNKHDYDKSYNDITKDNNNNIVNMAVVSGVFTIVDRIESKSKYDEDIGVGYGRDRQKDVAALLLHDGNICLIRPLFVGVFTFIGLLCATESSIVFMYFYSRFKNNGGPETEGSQTETGTKSRTPVSTATRPSSSYFVQSETEKEPAFSGNKKYGLNLASVDHRISGAARILRKRANQVWAKRSYRVRQGRNTHADSSTGTLPSSQQITSDSDQYPESVAYGPSLSATSGKTYDFGSCRDVKRSTRRPAKYSSIRSNNQSINKCARISRMSGKKLRLDRLALDSPQFALSGGMSDRLSARHVSDRKPQTFGHGQGQSLNSSNNYTVYAETHPIPEEKYSVPSKQNHFNSVDRPLRNRENMSMKRRNIPNSYSYNGGKMLGLQKPVISRRPPPPAYRLPPPPSTLSTAQQFWNMPNFLGHVAQNRAGSVLGLEGLTSPNSFAGGSTLDGKLMVDANSDDGSQTGLLREDSGGGLTQDALLLKKVQFNQNRDADEETYSRGYRSRELRNQAKMQSMYHEIQQRSSEL